MEKSNLTHLKKKKLSRSLLKTISAGDGNGATGLNLGNGGNTGCGTPPQITSLSQAKYEMEYKKWLDCLMHT